MGMQNGWRRRFWGLKCRWKMFAEFLTQQRIRSAIRHSRPFYEIAFSAVELWRPERGSSMVAKTDVG